MSRFRRVLTGALACALAPALLGQAVDAEQEILELQSAGRYRESLRKTAALLDQALQEPSLAPEQAARAEFLLAVAESLANKVPDHAALVSLLQDLRRRPAALRAPVLRGWIDHHLAKHLVTAGRPADGGAVLDRLGYASDFLVLGPLDNERGSGFRRAFAPEQWPGAPVDLDRRYDGKKRKVGFRSVQIRDVPTRTLDLGALLRPNTQVLAYAAFVANAVSAREACLRVASTGSIAVFVNGLEVLRRDCQRRPLGADQDACTFRLRAGDNLVVAKICVQEGGFAARMRLTTPAGEPLTEIEKSAEPARVAAAAALPKVPAHDKAALPPKLGAVTWLTRQATLRAERAEPGTGDARRAGMLAFRLAYLLALRAEDDDSERRDRKWARTAIRLLPDFGAAHHLHAFTLRRVGGSIADRDENTRLRALSAAIDAWPRCAEAMRLLAKMERTSRDNLSKAEDWIRKALAINPHFALAAAERLTLLDKRGFDAGLARAVAAYRSDPKLADHPAILQRAIELAEKRRDTARMVELQKALIAREYEPRALSNLALMLLRRGDVDGALRAAEQAVAEFPHQRRAWSVLAGVRVAAGDVDAAMRTWSSWLEHCPDDEQACLAVARLAARQGQTVQQIAHLERAVALNPNLKDHRRHLEFLKAGEETFYSGLEIDAGELRRGDRGPDPDADEKGDSHYYALRHTVVRAYRDGTTSRYDHYVVRVLNEEGANLFDTYQPPFHRGDQTARILEAKVVRPGGGTERARLGRSSWVDLPVIRPGDWVEIASRVDDRSRSFFGDYFGHTHVFAASEPVPVRRSRLDLLLEPGRKYHFQRVGDVPEPAVEKRPDGTEHRRYEMTALGRRKVEERAPSALESGPLLRVSTYGDWNELASWWWNLIRKQTVPTDALKARVRELVAGAQTLEEKVQRIYDFVVTEIRYKAWEFGVHGYKPYSVGAILARRHGDCKDKAILMNAMLAEIGVTAYPVLIHAEESRERDDLTLPMVQHFNHCISYIPAQQGLPARFVDGTAEYHAIDTIPSMDRGANVLAVLGEKGETMSIPWTAPEDNRDELHYHVQLKKDGSAVVEMVHRPRLNFAPAVRRTYGNEEGKRRQKLSDRLGRVFGEVEILDLEFSDLRDLAEPVEYRVRFEVMDFCARLDTGYRVKTAFSPENLSRMTAAEERSRDMLLRTPSSRAVTVVYDAPEGFAWHAVPEATRIESPVGSFRMEIERKDRRLTVRRVRALRTQRISRAAYPEFKKLAEAVDRAEALQLVLRPVN